MFTEFISAALLSLFLQNTIYERAMGTNILLYAARERRFVVGFSLMITYITGISSVFAWLLDRFVLPADSGMRGMLSPLLYVFVVSAVYLFSLLFIWRFLPKLFKLLRPYVHLSVFNCSVLGSLFISNIYGESLLAYLGFGLGTGIGFLIAGWLMYIAYPRLNSELVPQAFRGMPIMTVYVGVLALALYAFVGYSTQIT
jgi:electron transport complex protein RnfA